MQAINCSDDKPLAIALAADSKYLVAICLSGFLRKWSVKTGELLHQGEYVQNNSWGSSLSAGAQSIAILDHHIITTYDGNNLKIIGTHNIDCGSEVGDPIGALSPTHKALFVLGMEFAILWDVASGKKAWQIPLIPRLGYPERQGAAWSIDEKWVAFTTMDGQVIVVEAQSHGREPRQNRYKLEIIDSHDRHKVFCSKKLVFNAARARWIVACIFYTIKANQLWLCEVESARQVKVKTFNGKVDGEMLFSKDGQYLAVSQIDETDRQSIVIVDVGKRLGSVTSS